ncbi:MAG: hypothetical protein ACE5LG_04780 [Anaerolineae bacterium]
MIVLSVGCRGKEENHAIRQAIVQEVLAKEAVEVLVIRLQPGEARADFGFEGDTVFFSRPREEEEFWRVSNPKLRYLFIKEISYDSQTEAHVGVEIRHADAIVSRMIDLRKVGGSWRVTLKSGAARMVCRSLYTGVRHSG